MLYYNGTVALDMGGRTVKAVLGKRTGRRISLIDYGSCDIPPDWNYDSGCEDMLADAVSKIIGRMKKKPRNAVIGISGINTITRYVSIPYVKESLLFKAAEYEFSQYLPLNHEKYIIRSEISYRREKDGLIDMLMVAAPNKTVNFYVNVANKLGLCVKGVNIFACSIRHLFSKSSTDKSTIGLVDLGYEHAEIIILEKGKLYFQRSINTPCRNIESSMQNDAERPNAAYDLAANISRVFDFYSSSRIGHSIGHLFIYGDGATIAGICDYMSSFLNVDTSVLCEKDIHRIYNMDKKFIDSLYVYLNCLSLLFTV